MTSKRGQDAKLERTRKKAENSDLNPYEKQQDQGSSRVKYADMTRWRTGDKSIMCRGKCLHGSHWKHRCLRLFVTLLVISLVVMVVLKDLLFCELFGKPLNPSILSSDGFPNAYYDTNTSDDLAKKVRIFCFVLTTPRNAERAEAVNATWLRRCSGSMFVSSSPLPFKNTLVVGVPDGRNHLTPKTFAAFQHLYQHHLEDYDWFLKGDDDLYVILENLRLFLSHLSPDKPAYLGHHFRFFVHNGYMSGGASYVLSKEALRRLGEKGVGSLTPLCSLEETSEDVAMGQCMEVLGVSPIKTSDVFGRQSFLPFSLEYVLFDQGNCVKSNFSLNPMSAGRECCSQLSISFHYIEPRMMYMIDMLLYRVSVYGRHGQDVALRTSVFKPQVEEIDHKDDQEIFYP